jgi:hypothetical protein
MKDLKVELPDILVLLLRNFPTIYEIHRYEIRQAKNLIFSTTDKEFAEKIVNSYNNSKH